MPTRRRIPSPADLSETLRYTRSRRDNKVRLAAFGRPMTRVRAGDFFESLPHCLKATDFREFTRLVARSRRRGRPFHLLMGAHVIKVGLSPVIIDLLKREIVTGISLNSAGMIHDLEVAFFGGTSEDVQSGLTDGSFGMMRETAQLFASACALADKEDIGLGQAAGVLIRKRRAPYQAQSLLAAAGRLGLPATIHVGIGTDIVAQHPEFDGAQAGRASHLDFRLLCSICQDIDRGGAIANVGSAVILPEVFLKALTVARNLRPGRSRLTTANFDMVAHYRPTMNVVTRPTAGAGKGFDFAGHHEIMVPLLAWSLRRELGW